ncbi:hypothetical protein ATANTOWER_030698 [Ataeniobius toweri]|uniref:Uncharacterized protein n=1 Tax=Ataeniobius toweri TaxID=208326 RepID=A0ABU7BLP4_9TELE|nr:hypothetical protein [Ataeniobius toweri]
MHPGHGLQLSQSLCKATSESDIIKKCFTWKKDWTVTQGSKDLFQIKVHFAFHLVIKVPNSEGKVERHRIRNSKWYSVVWMALMWFYACLTTSGLLGSLRCNLVASDGPEHVPQMFYRI